jgi:hypothetical protein
MITTAKNSEGFVTAYLACRQVGQSGIEKFRGEYLFISDLWIHSSHHNDWSIYRSLMHQALLRSKGVMWIYFERHKYNDRLSKLYTKEKIMKLLDRNLVGV